MISWLRNRRRFVSFINIWHRNIHIYLLLSRDELSRWFAQRESLMDILWNTYTIIMKRMDHIRLCQKSRSVWTVFAIWSRTVLWFPCHGVIWNKTGSQEGRDQVFISDCQCIATILEERGFTAESTGGVKRSNSLLLDDAVRPYYRDYIDGESTNSYRSLHITFLTTVPGVIWKCSLEQKRWMILQKLE